MHLKIGGESVFVFKPYPPFSIAIGDWFFCYPSVDDVRAGKIPSNLKEGILKVVGESRYGNQRVEK